MQFGHNRTLREPLYRAYVTRASDQGEPKFDNSPLVREILAGRGPEIVVGTNEEYEPSADGGVNAGNLNTASLALLAASGQLAFANTRLYAIKPGGEPGGPPL